MEQLEPAEIEALVGEFHKKLDRLKTLYDQYFLGVAKREPLVPLKDVVRVMRLLEQQQIRNTGVRYRFRTLVQKLSVYRTLWNRTLRQIEAGTHKRELRRVRDRLKEKGYDASDVEQIKSAADVEKLIKRGSPKPKRSASELRGKPADVLRDEIDDAFDMIAPGAKTVLDNPAVRPPPTRSPAAPAPAPAPAPAVRSSVAAGNKGAIDADTLQSIYRRLVKAKRICGEDITSVKYEAVARSVSSQVPKLRQMHPGKEIEFQVVIRNGRAVLKAGPKKP